MKSMCFSHEQYSDNSVLIQNNPVYARQTYFIIESICIFASNQKQFDHYYRILSYKLILSTYKAGSLQVIQQNKLTA